MPNTSIGAQRAWVTRKVNDLNLHVDNLYTVFQSMDVTFARNELGEAKALALDMYTYAQDRGLGFTTDHKSVLEVIKQRMKEVQRWIMRQNITDLLPTVRDIIEIIVGLLALIAILL